MTEADKLWVLNNKDKVKKSQNDWKKRNPWRQSYDCAKKRCKGDKSKYGIRGIKFNMTVDDFKFLWFRDRAYEMKRPSIDRIITDGDYELGNCQYIEFKENVNKQKSKRRDSK